MKNSVHYLSRGSAKTVGLGACAVLLAACGGSDGGNQATPGAEATPRLAAEVTYNSALAATELYVSTTGSDNNAGTKAAPFLTIGRASLAASAGTVVHVAPGVYAGGFVTNASGSATARIRYVSDVKWGAKIVPPATSTTAMAWDNRGSYVDIEGFDVDGSVVRAGTVWTTGIYTGGTFGGVRSNRVHHIGRSACASGGGIGADSYFGGSAHDVRANMVHDIGANGCATMYGIYVNSAGTDVKNNLIYGVSNAAVRLWHDAAGVDVANNTIFASHIGVVVGSGDYYFAKSAGDNSRVTNNIVYDTAYGVVEKGNLGANNTYANNLMFQQTSGAYLMLRGVAVATIAAAPQFVNYVRTGGGDYHLRATSPAIDKALAADAPPVDYDGKPRPSGAADDVGAFEYVGAAPTPTPTPSPAPAPAPTPTPAPSPVPATANHLYVAPTGSDNNSGALGSPLRSIGRAAALAAPNTTVHVAPGTYSGGFRTNTSGTANGRIYYVSTTKWGARIVPPSGSTSETAWDNRGNYVDIIGFDIDGSAPQGGTLWRHGIYNGGSYDVIRGNHVHHIATTIPCNGGGAAAIGVDSYYMGVKGDVINNLVHDIGPSGCSFVQGIYLSTSGSVVGNVVYRVAEAAIHLWHDANNVIIANNTVTNSDLGILVGAGDFYHSNSPNDNTHVVNNIVYDNRYGISEQGSTGTHNTYRNNLVYQNSNYNYSLRNGLQPTGSVNADPQFVAYSRTGTPDLHLRSTSPAKGAGTSAYAPAYDIEGTLMQPISIGAYK